MHDGLLSTAAESLAGLMPGGLAELASLCVDLAGMRLRGASRRVGGRVLLVGNAAEYEAALSGEGVSLAVKQAAAAVTAIIDDAPSSYERAWYRITRDYRLLTRGLVLASVPPMTRRAIVPACTLLPGVFKQTVHTLAH